MKRVLMTADTIGGVWTFALDLARGLESVGTNIALATMGKKLDSGQRADAEQIPNLEIFESDFKLEWMQDPWDDVRRAGDWLLSLEAGLKPDVVHLNTLAHGALPWEAPSIVTGHSCVLSWWAAVKHESAPSEWDRYREEVKASLQAADLVTAPSQVMLHELQNLYGLHRDGMVIPNGRDFRCEQRSKEPLIFAAGRLWDEAKNTAALERIAPRLPWPVYVSGEQRHPDGGVAMAPSTRSLGRLPAAELAAWYSRASIYTLPARYEPFGLSILEAALSGCALVLGDIPSLREVWGDAALWVAPEDDSQLESALWFLIADETRREEFGARARQRAERFTPERMLEGYLAA